MRWYERLAGPADKFDTEHRFITMITLLAGLAYYSGTKWERSC